MDWTKEEVWAYIRQNNVPVNPFYERFPNQRVGCMPCTGHIGWEKKMAEAFPGMYRVVQMKRGQMLIDDPRELVTEGGPR
jgi:3'-phosphoadenosine 5'-phosphosulfate sulfotransferase (PAPS reductase)/FAD synthetase